ncbi:MAG: hypothetical protein A2Y48_05115 [Nitrospirae bacterium RIFCSPLOW2_12_42_9]|nr:MAG: hypothetical protein A2Y48_05115 [Nitrospirae bacterium RIFCSPLOW2_12_42_9]
MEVENTVAESPVIKIVGIRLRDQGMIVHYDPQDFNFRIGDNVIIETDSGEGIARVASLPRYVLKVLNNRPLKRVLRLPTPEDLARLQDHSGMEKDAYSYCLERIKGRNLPMKLIEVEYTFDESKIIFYFTSDTRVDFRELVKDLAYKFKARIELRQVGIRDGARMISGYGLCGLPLCCGTFLMEFEPVSIRMARDQDMVINPVKISGMCGRLMCCIAFEHGVEDEKG